MQTQIYDNLIVWKVILPQWDHFVNLGSIQALSETCKDLYEYLSLFNHTFYLFSKQSLINYYFRMVKDMINEKGTCRVIHAFPKRFYLCRHILFNPNDPIEQLEKLLVTYPNYPISTLEIVRDEFIQTAVEKELGIISKIMGQIPITTNGESRMVPRPAFSLILKYSSRSFFTFNLNTIPANISSLTIIICRGEVYITNIPPSVKSLSVEGSKILFIKHLDSPRASHTALAGSTPNHHIIRFTIPQGAASSFTICG